MARELRQSSGIIAANSTSVTFKVDFSDNKVVDPDTVTYGYDPATRQLTLTANETKRSAGDPYRSSRMSTVLR
jgi:hypothetical protein